MILWNHVTKFTRKNETSVRFILAKILQLTVTADEFLFIKRIEIFLLKRTKQPFLVVFHYISQNPRKIFCVQKKCPQINK